MKLLIHIVTHRRKALLQKCLNSVLKSLPDDSHVHIVANACDPDSLAYLGSLRDRQVSWEEVKKESLSASRNRGLFTQGYDLIHYLDDDVEVPAGLFQKIIETFEDEDLTVVGGPNLTPPGSPYFERLLGATMQSPFCAPQVYQRYSSSGCRASLASEQALIFCNLALRIKNIPGDLRFLETLTSNQENLFLYQLRQHGLKVLYDPTAFVYHHRRKTHRLFMQQIFSYGRGRWEQTFRAPLSCHPLFLFPSLCLLLSGYLILSGKFFVLIFFAKCYFLIGLLSSLTISEIRGLGGRGLIHSLLITFLVHLSYGWGFLFAMAEKAMNNFSLLTLVRREATSS